MSIKYYKLFDILQRRGLRKTDLLRIAGISSPTLAKLSKGDTITTEVIEKICNALDLQPGDIMEHINNNEVVNDNNGSEHRQQPKKSTTLEELMQMRKQIQEEPEEEHIQLPWEE